MEVSERRVLVVDDMPTILRKAENILKDRYTVETAVSADEALSKLSSFHPDIVLMDMNMPDKNGITCMEEIHAKPEYKDLPIILMINDLSIISSARAYDSGVADFVKKPFIPINVFRKIEMHLKLAEIGWRFEG